MKFFAAVKNAKYAEAAFKAAGLDFEKLAAANDVDAIKTALAARPAPDADEGALSAAVEENQVLAAQNEELKGKLTDSLRTSEKLSAVVTAVGLPTDKSAEEIKAAHDLNIAKQARLMVAKAGHPGVDDDVATKPAAKQEAKKEESTLTGRDRMARDFSRQINRINQREREDRRN